ncbi:haloacid dehalogenase, type II [Cordyceps fumosorosea ARSEF 2679]|uniref:Haloacid dehalogenase, type II n=1 Tax=Cordyceps fumosorosea (strain ARSEF 2679) TaxID=1081104 RepID=A0A167NBV7_CORFA|nr:haloacid dehalogenase, type II [Cordyceps fumosorosea ARSEF 2679]OAA55372.1 haloacid dehalogenase, type II [Cordyceps fumosorosea ARSEF 2679]
MSPSAVSPLVAVKALAFDVFGTTVDWRTSVIDELDLRVHRKLATTTTTITTADAPGAAAPSPDLRERLAHLPADWTARFADAWRASYWRFVRSQALAGLQDASAAFKTTDAHFRDSLVELLAGWRLTGLFSEAEVASLSMVWHRLAPWPDSAAGLARLAAAPLGLRAATLSNGSAALVADLDEFGGLGFGRLLCAEGLRAYKPAREAYEGAAKELGVRPGEVAMVAAHMADLEAARAAGMRTVYVKRRGEEEWDDKRLEEARAWVDLWIDEEEEGFVTLAERLEEMRA